MNEPAELGALDPFRTVAFWDPTTAAEWAAALDQRAACADQVRLRATLRELAALRPGDYVVELGCGTGALLAELAGAVGSGGRVLGVEPQPAFVDVARRRAAAVPGGGNVTVHIGSAAHIPATDATVDACLAQTVLIHLADPRLLGEAGYRDVSVRVLTHLDTTADSYLFGMSVRLARAAEEAGAIDPGAGCGMDRRARGTRSGGQLPVEHHLLPRRGYPLSSRPAAHVAPASDHPAPQPHCLSLSIQGLPSAAAPK